MKIILEGTSEEIKSILGTFGNETNVINLTVNQTKKDNTPEGYVDLGLPSGTLWATCNLGATKPEEYGLYYQWGDTVGYTGDDAKAHSDWETMPFNDGASDYNSTYFASVSDVVCPNGVLAPKYDAVFQATNGVAHMPTKEQFEELLCYTNHEWATVNGVKGRKFTSKKDPTKYIFVPSAGSYERGSFYFDINWPILWTSSLNKKYLDCAWLLRYRDSPADYMTVYTRCHGFCVRGVIG